MALDAGEPWKRQTYYGPMDGDDSDIDRDWWYSDTAEIVKYVIIACILGFIVLWVVGGAWHAKRRIRKGQPPMLYHRWLVSSRHRQRYSQAQPYGYGQGGQPGFQMNNWNYAPPPPAYGHDAPPGYQAPPGPPPGASKVNPDQTTGVVEVTPHNGESSGGAGPSIQPPAPTQAANPFQSQR